MDFFEHQDRARRGTFRLILLFAAAVVCVCLAVYAAVAVASVIVQQNTVPEGGRPPPVEFWNPTLFVAVTGGTLLIIGFGTLHKMWQLSGGGDVVARMLGGRPVPLDSGDPDLQKLMNVVEEMAIASGVPTPQVFILPEDGINAFAAGTTIETSVVGVTRGCVKRLSRDELQGVIAHEFSHILHGDCRMNMRLMGVLHGILVIGLGGVMLMRGSYYASLAGGNRRSSNNNAGAVLIAMVALGAALMAIGSIGTFFGNLIKAGVSRQREFLADASAVQFTRNPEGIAGALKKIGGAYSKGRLRNPRAGEASHMFFAQGVPISMAALLSTHPPLSERIKRIEPSWDGQFVRSPRPEPEPVKPGEHRLRKRVFINGEEVYSDETTEPARGRGLGQLGTIIGAAAMADALGGAGAVTPAAVGRASELLASIPPALKAAAEEPFGARAVVFALLLDQRSEDTRREQLRRLRDASDEGMAERTDALARRALDLPGPCRLPLLDLAVGALRHLSERQYETFRQNVGVFIAADNKLDAFEWTVQRIVVRTLDRHFGLATEPSIKYHTPGSIRRPLSDLISLATHVGHADDAEARKAFAAAARRMPGLMLSYRQRGEVGLGELNASAEALEQSSWKIRRDALAAVLAAVESDGRVTVREAELFRGLAAAVGVPMPPVVATD